MNDRHSNRKLPSAAVTSHMEKIADALEIPKEFLAGTVKVTVTGSGELLVEGRLSVIQYTDSILTFAVAGLIITIEGENFEVPEFDSDYLKLIGKIQTINYIS